MTSLVKFPLIKFQAYAYQSIFNTKNNKKVINKNGTIIAKAIKKPKNQILIFDKFQCIKLRNKTHTSFITCFNRETIEKIYKINPSYCIVNKGFVKFILV
jgi:hypothetical protein